MSARDDMPLSSASSSHSCISDSTLQDLSDHGYEFRCYHEEGDEEEKLAHEDEDTYIQKEENGYGQEEENENEHGLEHHDNTYQEEDQQSFVEVSSPSSRIDGDEVIETTKQEPPSLPKNRKQLHITDLIKRVQEKKKMDNTDEIKEEVSAQPVHTLEYISSDNISPF